jgi:hypothetical protein
MKRHKNKGIENNYGNKTLLQTVGKDRWMQDS